MLSRENEYNWQEEHFPIGFKVWLTDNFITGQWQ